MFDIFLLDGWILIFKVALAIHETFEEELLGLSFEEILQQFQLLPDLLHSSAEDLISLSLASDVTMSELEELEVEYRGLAKDKFS